MDWLLVLAPRNQASSTSKHADGHLTLPYSTWPDESTMRVGAYPKQPA